MPAYEYECPGCGNHFERRQKMSDPEVEACPSCGGPVRRLISGGAGVIAKGGSPAAGPCGSGEGCAMPPSGCGDGMCGCGH